MSLNKVWMEKNTSPLDAPGQLGLWYLCIHELASKNILTSDTRSSRVTIKPQGVPHGGLTGWPRDRHSQPSASPGTGPFTAQTLCGPDAQAPLRGGSHPTSSGGTASATAGRRGSRVAEKSEGHPDGARGLPSGTERPFPTRCLCLVTLEAQGKTGGLVYPASSITFVGGFSELPGLLFTKQPDASTSTKDRAFRAVWRKQAQACAFSWAG